MNSYRLPAPQDWQEFQRLCCALWRKIWSNPEIQQVGRNGQTQNGVDIVGQPNGESNWCGIQCKTMPVSESLSESDLEDEVQKARAFQPKLSRYIVATTGLKDARLEEVARTITSEHQLRGEFSVTVLGWDDILELLTPHWDVVRVHFSQFFPERRLNESGNEGSIDAAVMDALGNFSAQQKRRNVRVVVDELMSHGEDKHWMFGSSHVFGMTRSLWAALTPEQQQRVMEETISPAMRVFRVLFQAARDVIARQLERELDTVRYETQFLARVICLLGFGIRSMPPMGSDLFLQKNRLADEYLKTNDLAVLIHFGLATAWNDLVRTLDDRAADAAARSVALRMMGTMSQFEEFYLLYFDQVSECRIVIQAGLDLGSRLMGRDLTIVSSTAELFGTPDRVELIRQSLVNMKNEGS